MNKQELVTKLAEHVVDGMDIDTLMTFVFESLEQTYSEYTDEELMTEVKEWAPHLLEE